MSSLNRELVFLILQFLDEEKFADTLHKLEHESGMFFNISYFEEQVLAGNWDEIETYLSGFTKVDDNRYSMKIFFEIRKQKYLEALDRMDRHAAVDILTKDLKVFMSFNQELYKEMTTLVTLDNFRENVKLSTYGDTRSARTQMMQELRKLIEANPKFRNKLTPPVLKPCRLRTLINQSLNWQHQQCDKPLAIPEIKTLFLDHSCGPSSGVETTAPTAPQFGVGLQGLPVSAAAAAAAAAAAGSAAVSGAASAAPSAGDPPVPLASMGLGKQPRALDISLLDDSRKRQRGPEGAEVYTAKDIPNKVVRTLKLGSQVTSFDFHPTKVSMILVGTKGGNVSLWSLQTGEQIYDQACASPVLPAPASINQVAWSVDGLFFGATFSMRVIHIYSYPSGMPPRRHLEIAAHEGAVNDLAFATPGQRLCVITCGDDKMVKVWDAASGAPLHSFAHTAPVLCVYPHHKESIQFIFSASSDGQIKAWLYDNNGPRVNYEAPGKFCTNMRYSGDGTRLFSCGVNGDGESSLVEWNEAEGLIKRRYLGFANKSSANARFDTLKDRFLVAGDEHVVKVWDMDNSAMLLQRRVDGAELPSNPLVRFNRPGSLLAAGGGDATIWVLSNPAGSQLLAGESGGGQWTGSLGGGKLPAAGGRGGAVEAADGVFEIKDRTALLWAELKPDPPAAAAPAAAAEGAAAAAGGAAPASPPAAAEASPISFLLYTNAGTALLSLAKNATHKLWKWGESGAGTDRKLCPEAAVWRPAGGGGDMQNDTSTSGTTAAVPCMALSKNDSYVLSGSGGKVSLFNMLTFKVMTTFMPSPPAATFLAFHPQDNNIVAVGMEDSTVQIYNVRLDEVKTVLRGHSERITGLAFSNELNILVSSAADAKMCMWGTTAYEKRGNLVLSAVGDGSNPSNGDVHVQFHQDQRRMLSIHHAQLAIYDAATNTRLWAWTPRRGATADPDSFITSATFSCTSNHVYTAFSSGAVAIFDSSRLRPICRLAPQVVDPLGLGVYVVEISAFPKPGCASQMALGLSNGTVQVVEPLSGPAGDWRAAMVGDKVPRGE